MLVRRPCSLCYIGWWLGRHWRAGWVTLVVLLLAALLLTPAYPKEGVDTMAPALIVAAFQFMTAGVEGARHALRPLIFMSGSCSHHCPATEYDGFSPTQGAQGGDLPDRNRGQDLHPGRAQEEPE